MELILKRIAKKKGYTIGELYVASPNLPNPSQGGVLEENMPDTPLSPPLEGQGEVFLCHTLEPQWRDYKNGAYKIKGKSAIPEGRYAVVISWSPKMKQWLPILLNVPMFSGIRIHAGNTAEDTEGCILVGKNKEVGKVLDSRIWLERLKRKIVEAKDKGEGVWIRVE